MLALEDITTTLSLNQGQQAAADGFMEFLFSPKKEMKISGPGGVGKTFLMGSLIDHVMPKYIETCRMMGIPPEFDSVVMTATTNKAAEVLALATNRPTETIHSFLGLKVQPDYATGKSKLIKHKGAKVHERLIVFVDEAFMIDTPLLTHIRQGTHHCKVVYVGDHCQLAPVMETVSPIHRAPLDFFELTENVRNAGQPALMAVCKQLRDTVETGVFQPIQIVPGVIDHVDDDGMQDLIAEVFHEQTREARILAFTNQRVQAFNDHIRSLRNLPTEYGRGELLVNNSALKLPGGMLSVEEEVNIIDQADQTEQFILGHAGVPISLEVRRSTLRTGLGSYHSNIPLPVDRDHFASLLRYFNQKKIWDKYYALKEGIPDLRPRDAATVHKAQGSTYEIVFIDLGDISTCHQAQTAARLLYVAFTRARSRVVLYGDLTKKYGGLVL